MAPLPFDPGRMAPRRAALLPHPRPPPPAATPPGRVAPGSLDRGGTCARPVPDGDVRGGGPASESRISEARSTARRRRRSRARPAGPGALGHAVRWLRPPRASTPPPAPAPFRAPSADRAGPRAASRRARILDDDGGRSRGHRSPVPRRAANGVGAGRARRSRGEEGSRGSHSGETWPVSTPFRRKRPSRGLGCPSMAGSSELPVVFASPGPAPRRRPNSQPCNGFRRIRRRGALSRSHDVVSRDDASEIRGDL
jgi:hypothetical protein